MTKLNSSRRLALPGNACRLYIVIIYTHLLMYMYTRAFSYGYVYKHMYVLISVYKCVCTYELRIHACTHMQKHAYRANVCKSVCGSVSKYLNE